MMTHSICNISFMSRLYSDSINCWE